MSVGRRQTPAKPQTDGKAEPSVKVTVAGRFQVSHEGKVYGPGESAKVPKSVADRWTLSGLVEPA